MNLGSSWKVLDRKELRNSHAVLAVQQVQYARIRKGINAMKTSLHFGYHFIFLADISLSQVLFLDS